ncbi:hypothetical protein D3C80_1588090 [compost metagenome]
MCTRSANDSMCRLASSISPIARMMQNTKKPMMAYTRMIEVPDSAMILPDPMNSPVPIAPLIEMS